MTQSACRPRIAMLTPWDQQCGNAEYAKRLASLLTSDYCIEPYELKNYIDPWTDDGIKITPAQIQADLKHLVDKINAQRYDIVHVQHEFCFFGARPDVSMLRFLWLLSRLKSPIALTIHTWTSGHTSWRGGIRSRLRSPVQFLKHKFVKLLMARCLERSKVIIVHSLYTNKLLFNLYPQIRGKLRTIPIPIQQLPASGSAALKKQVADLWIVLPGFITPYKGHIHALNALKMLPSNYKLIFAGGVHPKNKTAADYWIKLLSVMDGSGLAERVRITGFIDSPADQAELFQMADVFVLPYDEVGQSGSAVLADVLAYKKPVITSSAISMATYRMTAGTVQSSIIASVESAEAFAAAIIDAIADFRAGDPQWNLALERAIDMYGPISAMRAYRKAFSFASPGT